MSDCNKRQRVITSYVKKKTISDGDKEDDSKLDSCVTINDYRMITWAKVPSLCSIKTRCSKSCSQHCEECWKMMFHPSRGIPVIAKEWFQKWDGWVCKEVDIIATGRCTMEKSIMWISRNQVGRDLLRRFRGYYLTMPELRPDSIDRILRYFRSLSEYAHYKDHLDLEIKSMREKKDYPFCTGHGKHCVKKKSKSDKNYGRDYFVCSQDEDNNCGFFMWEDGEWARVGNN